MNQAKLDVPYFSQWESPEMTLPVLAEGASALHRDPLWTNSGADTIEEYARWAVNVCGMACLKMILAARGKAHPILSLARACITYGGYVVNEADAAIKVLIYAPFVTFVRERFGLAADVRTRVPTEDIPEILTTHRFFIASISSAIRWPDCEPPGRGGHLVLVTAADQKRVCASTTLPAMSAPPRPMSPCRLPHSTASLPTEALRSASEVGESQ